MTDPNRTMDSNEPQPRIRIMQISDHDRVIELMRRTPGVVVRAADAREPVGRYLERNPGLSFVAELNEQLVGCIMSGHDGRRGYLRHLVVDPAFRGQGLARQLVQHAVDELARCGIDKSYCDVLVTNTAGAAFWQRIGWARRDDVYGFSFVRSGSADA